MGHHRSSQQQLSLHIHQTLFIRIVCHDKVGYPIGNNEDSTLVVVWWFLSVSLAAAQSSWQPWAFWARYWAMVRDGLEDWPSALSWFPNLESWQEDIGSGAAYSSHGQSALAMNPSHLLPYWINLLGSSFPPPSQSAPPIFHSLLSHPRSSSCPLRIDHPFNISSSGPTADDHAQNPCCNTLQATDGDGHEQSSIISNDKWTRWTWLHQNTAAVSSKRSVSCHWWLEKGTS